MLETVVLSWSEGRRIPTRNRCPMHLLIRQELGSLRSESSGGVVPQQCLRRMRRQGGAISVLANDVCLLHCYGGMRASVYWALGTVRLTAVTAQRVSSDTHTCIAHSESTRKRWKLLR